MRRLPPLAIRTRLTLWYSAVLFAILVAIGALSYYALGWSLTQDLDASLSTVAQILHDTTGAEVGTESEVDALLRELLGRDFYDSFFQMLDPQGHRRPRPAPPRERRLPLSALARANAERGLKTFETVQLPGGERTRLVTWPVMRRGRVVDIVQVGAPLERTEGALRRYRHTLLVLIPLGVALAAAGGAVIARAALRPVDEMAAAARRITAEDLHQRIALAGTDDELERLAETLNGMLARLDQAFGQMRRFAADAAHELRTPLTALKGGIEVALRSARTPEEYQRVLASSLEEVDRLIRVAEDLLLLSRAVAGLETARARVDLEPLVLEALDVATRLAQGTGVHVQLGHVVPAAAMGDQRALARAVRNLVENAIKYTPAGGKVELSLSASGGEAALAVQDTGLGVAAADTERIFEPFVRLDAARARETGGSGLGLAIARSIVTAHGGTLTVESEENAGSRFTIRLPLAEPGRRIQATSRDDAHPRVGEGPGGFANSPR
jgi:heavy metal sensor kinase